MSRSGLEERTSRSGFAERSPLSGLGERLSLAGRPLRGAFSVRAVRWGLSARFPRGARAPRSSRSSLGGRPPRSSARSAKRFPAGRLPPPAAVRAGASFRPVAFLAAGFFAGAFLASERGALARVGFLRSVIVSNSFVSGGRAFGRSPAAQKQAEGL
ncbi:MAG: hypothetical protein IOD12_12120 [Silvanigrellales bacterium]|nr:hypothetical protein [Silvanigrellales bacterium]